MNQVQNLHVIKPVLAQCLNVSGIERSGFRGQVDGKLHNGFFACRSARRCRVGKHLGDHVIAFGQLFETLRVHRSAIHTAVDA